MSSKALRPLRLLPKRISSWADGGNLSAPNDRVAVMENYSWEGRPPRASKAGECPLVWGAAHAAGAAGMSTEDYLASVKTAVPGGWGLPRRLLRRPKAVIYFTPDFFDDPSPPFPNPVRDALASLSEDLLTRGVFAGKVFGTQDRTCFPTGMPPSSSAFAIDTVLLDLGSGPEPVDVPSITKTFTAGDAEGGEVLYLSLYDLGAAFDMFTGIDFSASYVPLPNLMAAEASYHSASAAAHDRAKWLPLLGGDEGSVTNGEAVAAQKVNIAAVVADATGADVELYYPGTGSYTEAYTLIYDKVRAAVRTFFNL